MKIVHISATKRSEGDLGGVPKFAWYLQKAIGCDIVIPGELKNFDNYDVVIGDGYFVGGANYNRQIVISVVHGCWKEFAIRNKKEKDFFGEVERQNSIWKNPKIFKVAVSKASAKYLKLHHGIEADEIILNGIDTEVFRPKNHNNKKPVVIYASNDYNKDGQGELGKIAELLKGEFEFRYLGAQLGEEAEKYSQGDIYIQRSFYEGNSYAALEAMACGLPVVASETGLFEDTVFYIPVGKVLPWNDIPENYSNAVRNVWSNYSYYDPRMWMIEHGSFEIFKKKWRDFLSILTVGHNFI